MDIKKYKMNTDKYNVVNILSQRDNKIDNKIDNINQNNMNQNNVNHPKHYNQGNIECIDAMESAYGTEAVIHFCMCNAFKYSWRFRLKNNREDILKCQWYQNKMVELENKLNSIGNGNNNKNQYQS